VKRVRRRLIVPLVCLCGLLASAGTASAAQILYAADGAGGNPNTNLYVLNPSTGAVVQTVGRIGFAVTGLALDPATRALYGSTGRNTDAPSPGSLITINKSTGAGTVVGDLFPDTSTAADITFTPDGTLYGWLEQSIDDLATINKSSGAATVVGDSGLSTFGSGIASNTAGVLYFAGEGDDGPLRIVDRNTGGTTTVATLSGTSNFSISALAFDAAGTLYGSRIPGEAAPGFASDLITINTSSGAITSLGPSVDRLDAIVFAPRPERMVTLKKKLKAKGTKVRLFGRVQASGDEAFCESNQTVQLQRKKLKAGKALKSAKFRRFRTLTTNATGDFSTRAKVKTTVKYRAVLPEGALCGGERSKGKKVKAR
jgi:hypothetical protein